MNDRYKSSEKRRVGWLCSYLPEELIIAAGVEPVRIGGEVEKLQEAEGYLPANFCPYLKNVLDTCLIKRPTDLEGIIFTSSCDGMRRLYDVWSSYVQTPFSYMLELPRRSDEAAVKYFSDQLSNLKTKLEETFEVDIADESMAQAISLMNERRAIMMGLFEMQKKAPPAYKGSELLKLCLEEMTGPKDAAGRGLKSFATAADPPEEELPRILVVGNVIDKLSLFQMVEAAGASVVAFDTCTGLRHYSGYVEEGSDPLESLARRYLLKPPCPRMSNPDRRIDYVRELVNDYSIDGIIYSSLSFCDYGLFDAPVLEKSIENDHKPFLTLQNDYLLGDEGQAGTRVEAFVEMIGD